MNYNSKEKKEKGSLYMKVVSEIKYKRYNLLIGIIFLIGAVITMKNGNILKMLNCFLFLIEMAVGLGLYSRYKQHNQKLTAAEKKIRILRHDLEDQVFSLKQLFAGNYIEEAKEMLLDIQTEYQMINKDDICKNPMLNHLLKRWEQICIENHIHLRYQIKEEAEIRIMPTDLCKIVSNLLKNAFEAVNSLDDFKTIDFTIRQTKNQFMLECRNLKSKKIKKLKEQKYRGNGVQILDGIINKYNGSLEILKNTEEYVTIICIRQ